MIIYGETQTLDLEAFGIEIPLPDSRASRAFNYLTSNPDLKSLIQKWHVEPDGGKASAADLLRVHTKEYVDRLFSSGLADEIIETFELIDSNGQYHRYNPANAVLPLPKLFDRILERVSGTIQCCRLALSKGFSFYFGGGTHHAQAGYGSGFCLVNDIVIAIRALQAKRKIQTAWVIDVDAHKGDGTAALTRSERSVVTLSIHMGNGWPLDGDPYDDTGRLNDSFIPSDIDIPIYSGEESSYVEKLSHGLQRLESFGLPDLAIVVSGADPYQFDELPSTDGLNLTLEEMRKRDLLIYRFLKERKIPGAYLMAGGYGEQVWEVYAGFLKEVLQDALGLKSEDRGSFTKA